MIKLLLFVLIYLLFIHCDKNKNPIKEPQPTGLMTTTCYDSTYFDTTIAVDKIQTPYFHLYAPKGATFDYGWVNNHFWAGYIKYGCDSLKFSYWPSDNIDLNPNDYYQLDSLQINGHSAVIGYAYLDQFEVNYIAFLIKSDSSHAFIRTHDYHYRDQAVKMFHSFKFGF